MDYFDLHLGDMRIQSKLKFRGDDKAVFLKLNNKTASISVISKKLSVRSHANQINSMFKLHNARYIAKKEVSIPDASVIPFPLNMRCEKSLLPMRRILGSLFLGILLWKLPSIVDLDIEELRWSAANDAICC
jgi:hypothetical protein